MKKEEFFQVLRKKLAVIEENELNDILSEYEQHIAMKMENGNITEEDAIQDFGNIDELVAEILESYHVKVNYNVQRKGEKQTQLKESTKSFCGKTYQKTKIMLKNGWDHMKGFFSQIIHKIKSVTGGKKEKIKNNTYEIVCNGNSAKCKGSNAMKKILVCSRKTLLFIKKSCIWLLKICWNLFCIFSIVTVGVFTAFAVFISGTAIVLLGMKYPVKGILIISLGMVLSSGAVLAGLYLLLKKKRYFIKEKVRRIVKITAPSILFLGILLSGFGVGVGFAEFTEFTYGGEAPLIEGKETTKKISCHVPEENLEKIYLEGIWKGTGNEMIEPEIVEDEAIPYGEVSYEIVGFGEMGNLMLRLEEINEYNQKSTYAVFLHNYSRIGNLEMFMTMKDKVLHDMKERKMYSYYMYDISSVKVFVNPSMMDYIELVE